MKHSSLATLLSSSVVLFALSATAATYGQSTEKPTTPDDEIVVLNVFEVSASADDSYVGNQSVSGTRTRTELANLPMSIQVFTDEFIKDIGARDLIDVVRYASGVTQGSLQGANDDDNTNFTLRGMASFLPMRNGFRRLRLATSANIDRVEILKGPASLLYGQLAPGGNVNYITKRPRPTQRFADIRLTVGSYDFHRAVLDTNIPIVSNKLALRLVSSAQDSHAITDRLYNTTTLFNPSLRWWILPETTLTVEYERSKRNTNAPRSTLPFAPTYYLPDRGSAVDRHFNTSTSDDYLDTDMEVLTAELIHKFNQHFTLRANYTDSFWFEKKKVNGANVTLAGPNQNLLPRRSLAYRDRGSWDSWLQSELVNNFKIKSVEVQNIIGYQHEVLEFRAKLNGTQVTPSPLVQWDIFDPSTWVLTNLTAADATTAPSTGNRSTNYTDSYYFTNQLKFFDGKLYTLAGLRIDELEVRSYNRSANTTNTVESPAAKVPQIGVLYKVTPQISLYSSYSESFLPLFSTSRRADGSYYNPEPQSGKGFDVGIKLQLWEGKGSLSLAYFDIENTNLIRSLQSVTVGGETFNPTEQSGVDRSTGIEFDAQLKPFTGTQIILSYGYTDAYVKSDVSNRLTRENHPLTDSARHVGAVFWRQNFGTAGPARNLYATVGANHVGKRSFNDTWNIIGGVPTPPPDLPSYTLANIGIGAKFKVFAREYDVSINVKNIFDEVYTPTRLYFGEPRIVEFTLHTRF